MSNREWKRAVQEASDWLTHSGGSNWTAEDDAKFRTWLEANPLNREAMKVGIRILDSAGETCGKTP